MTAKITLCIVYVQCSWMGKNPKKKVSLSRLDFTVCKLYTHKQTFVTDKVKLEKGRDPISFKKDRKLIQVNDFFKNL